MEYILECLTSDICWIFFLTFQGDSGASIKIKEVRTFWDILELMENIKIIPSKIFMTVTNDNTDFESSDCKDIE